MGINFFSKILIDSIKNEFHYDFATKNWFLTLSDNQLR